MLILPAADTIAGVASAASEVTCTLFLMELNGTTETYTKDQQQLAASVATIYTVPGSTITEVRAITVVNTDAVNSNTFQLFVGGTAAANAITPVFTLTAGGMATYTDGRGWAFYSGAGHLIVDGRPARVSEQVALMGGTVSAMSLTADASPTRFTTGHRVMAMALPVGGTYEFKFYVIYSAGSSSHGVSFGINYTGVVTDIAGWFEYPGSGQIASTGIHSMIATDPAGNVHESFGFRAISTTAPNIGSTASQDTSNSYMLGLIKGSLQAGTGGELELWQANESDNQTVTVTVMRGTSLIVSRLA